MRRITVGLTVALLLATLLLVSGIGVVQAQSEQPVVRVVLFYSPTCPHCEAFIQNDLPTFYETYGDQLQVIGVNTLESEGWALYQAAAEHFSIPESRRGVPTLIAADTVMVGSDEINQQLPAIIERGLAGNGIGLPDVPELQAAVQQSEAEAASQVTPEQTSLSMTERFRQDLAGNSLALVVLLGMLGALAFVIISGRPALYHPTHRASPHPTARDWLIPVLSLIGLGVAGYLTYVETQDVSVICGPVGDCNTVQQSAYARLFGVLPIGLLGIIGYGGILAAWAWRRLDSHCGRRTIANVALFTLAGLGLLFSIYLTFLEPFIIGATCAWCLTSAIVITLLFLLTAQSGVGAARVLTRPAKTRSPAHRQRV